MICVGNDGLGQLEREPDLKGPHKENAPVGIPLGAGSPRWSLPAATGWGALAVPRNLCPPAFVFLESAQCPRGCLQPATL